MFQYAFAYSISIETSNKLILDINNYSSYKLRKYELDKYSIKAGFSSINESDKLKYQQESLLKSLFRKIQRKHRKFSENYYNESTFSEYDFDQQEDAYFDGYWQSEKYFQEYKDDLLKLFTLKESIHTQSKQYQQKILSSQSVSLHVRRGDYVSNTHTNSVHGICKLSYYQKATSLLESIVKKPHYFVFSDDIAWAKENLDFIKHRTIVELEQNIPDHEEMFLMSQCQHNIIANSSFSWWGAWLNQNEDKIIIAPLRWFNDMKRNKADLIPESWLCI